MNSSPSQLLNCPQVQVNSKTWGRDSHGLFDFENSQVKVNQLSLAQNGSLVRKKNYIFYIPDSTTEEEKKIILQGIEIPENQINILGKFIFENSDSVRLSNKLETNLPINNQTLTDLQEKIWFVVKSNSNNNSILQSAYISDYRYELRKNDIIKLGRIKFAIKDINIAEGTYQTTEKIFKPFTECEKIIPGEGEICRICLFNTCDNEDDPIISICKCKGSVNLIHLNCLKLWLGQKLSTREVSNKPGISYTVKSFNCELCKEPYPTTISYKGKLYHLLNYFEPEGQNYLILESLNSIKENQYPLSIHVLMFIDPGDSFILGRGHESDVRISDISVSRQHARITYKDKKFLLEDTGSKFGTLVLAKEPVPIIEKPVILQIGRTLFSLSTSASQNLVNDEKETLKSKLSSELDLEDDILNKLKMGYKDPSDGEEEN